MDFIGLQRLIRNPGEYLHPFSDAVTEITKSIESKYLKEGERILVGFNGPFGFHKVTPRDLMSSFIGTMVCVEGIVTKCKSCSELVIVFFSLLMSGVKFHSCYIDFVALSYLL